MAVEQIPTIPRRAILSCGHTIEPQSQSQLSPTSKQSLRHHPYTSYQIHWPCRPCASVLLAAQTSLSAPTQTTALQIRTRWTKWAATRDLSVAKQKIELMCGNNRRVRVKSEGDSPLPVMGLREWVGDEDGRPWAWIGRGGRRGLRPLRLVEKLKPVEEGKVSTFSDGGD